MDVIPKNTNTKIIPDEAPEVVTYIMDNIIAAIKTPNSNITLKPGIKYFKEVSGEQNGQEFRIKHIPIEKRGDKEKIYALYNGLEFVIDYNSLKNEFLEIDSYINKKYIYDQNTNTYVLRPNEVSFWNSAFSKLFKGRER